MRAVGGADRCRSDSWNGIAQRVVVPVDRGQGTGLYERRAGAMTVSTMPIRADG